MYKIFSGILVILALSFSVFSTSTNAETIGEIENEIEMDARLLELGYPDRLIKELHITEKERIANSDEIAEFSGGKTTHYDLNGQVVYEDDYTSTTPLMMPYGTIVNMTVTQWAQRLVTSSNREIFELESKYQWNISPVNRLTDLIGFAWDGNKFNLIPNTSYLVVGGTGWDGPGTHTTNKLYSSSFSGAGWAFPMPKTGTRPIAAARIRIQEISAIGGTSQIHSLYSHIKGNGTVGLNLGILSVSYVGTALNDQRATVTNFNY